MCWSKSPITAQIKTSWSLREVEVASLTQLEGRTCSIDGEPSRTSRPAKSVSLILDLSPDWLHPAEALQIVERLYVSYRTGELFPCCAPSLALFSASEEACLIRSFFGYHLTYLQEVGGGAGTNKL